MRAQKMLEKNQNPGFAKLLKNLAETLTTPINISGRKLTPAEIRAKRAARARQQYSVPQSPTTQTVKQIVPKPKALTMSGVIKPGVSTEFSIEEIDFVVDAGTFMIGEIKLGSHATIRYVMAPNGIANVSSITINKSH